MFTYFPSCNFTKASPESAKKLRQLLRGKMPVAGCCRFDKHTYGPEETALYFCQACREVLESKMNTENLFVYLDREEIFPLPAYPGLTVNLQDCWRDRNHPEIHKAVRSLLGKMEINLVEIEESREKATFCGNLHVEPAKEETRKILAACPNISAHEIPPEKQALLMAEQVEKFNQPLVVTYCNRCTAGLQAGGGEAVHLMNLLLGEFARS